MISFDDDEDWEVGPPVPKRLTYTSSEPWKWCKEITGLDVPWAKHKFKTSWFLEHAPWDNTKWEMVVGVYHLGQTMKKEMFYVVPQRDGTILKVTSTEVNKHYGLTWNPKDHGWYARNGDFYRCPGFDEVVKPVTPKQAPKPINSIDDL